jgi:peptidyl-tRNA hydrolase, PTH1 family
MKLVIGLGNPGTEYLNTRHNTGILVVDELQKEIQGSKREILNKSQIKIFKSSKFMNESGFFVSKQLKAYGIKPEALYVIHDDLDIKLGEYKIQYGRGPKDHNGLKSIDEELSTDQYWHVRIGVDNRPFDNRPMGEEYVLENFSDEERNILDRTIKQVVNKLSTDLTCKEKVIN